MKLIPHIHLDDWDIAESEIYDDIIYENGKIRVVENSRNGKMDLYIKSSDNEFFKVKRIKNYWELMSYHIFLNQDTIEDEETGLFQIDLMNNIRDNFTSFETLVFVKHTGNVFGVNDLLGSEGWNDKTLETMWENNQVIILDLLEDVEPKILTKEGWMDINVNPIGEDVNNVRARHIKEIL